MMENLIEENNISISEQYREEIQKENLKFQCYLRLESMFSRLSDKIKTEMNLREKTAKDLNFEEFLNVLYHLNLSLSLKNDAAGNEVTIFKK
jgi:hypothetical protein